MTINFAAEKALTTTPAHQHRGGNGQTNTFMRRVQDTINANRQALGQMKNQDLPFTQAFNKAIAGLDSLRQGAQSDDRISIQEKQTLKQSAIDVRTARAAAEREQLRGDQVSPGSSDHTARVAEPKKAVTGTSSNQDSTVQNEGEKGIYRDPTSGEVVRRDQGAKTLLEKADEQGTYHKSGRLRYREGAEHKQVENGHRIIREGDKGAGVRSAQQALQDAGFDVGGVDGFFGPKTAKAFAQFAKEHNVVSGRIGQQELALLQKLANGGSR